MLSWLLSTLLVALAAGSGRPWAADEHQEALPQSPSDEVLDVRSNSAQRVSTSRNYFGDAAGSGLDPARPLANDVTFEQLVAVGFNPLLDILTATSEIKLGTGF